MKVYSIFDVKAEVYNTPFFQPTNGVALRAFVDLANDKGTTVGKHPGDFKLVYLGSFDVAKGVFSSDEIRTLGFASDFVKEV